jgi:dolichol-phosphate mannosyltransferase
MNDKIHIRGLKFNIISLAALGVSYTTFLILSVVNPTGIPQVHQAIGIVPATLINYFLNSYWTFKE